MPLFPVGEVGKVGLIADLKGHELPPNAWTSLQNARCAADGIAKIPGERTVLAAPTVRPYWLLPVPRPTEYFWIAAGLAKVYAFDASTSANITRQTAAVDVDYAATAQETWSGGVLGGVPVLNNGVDVPQMWTPGLGNKLVALSNWPVSTTAKIFRTFRNFLVALDVTKSGTRYHTLVKWSHGADAGAVPSSWDETDATKDTGEYPLAETAGACIDAVPLRDSLVIYKEDSIWTMQYIGGVFVMKFASITTGQGMPTKDCAVQFRPGKHLFWSGDDLIMHDGQQMESILSDRVASVISGVDGSNYQSAFMVNNALQQEVWFCWGEDAANTGLATKALIWNWKFNTFSMRDLNLTAFIAPGFIDESATGAAWGADSETWDADGASWDAGLSTRAQAQLLSAQTVLRRLDVDNDFAGTDYQALFERTGLGVPLKEGQPPDISSWKLLRQVWPRVSGMVGATVWVTVGSQASVDAPVVWAAPQAFVIGTSSKVDCLVSGRLLAIRFAYTGAGDFAVHGYSLDVEFLGTY